MLVHAIVLVFASLWPCHGVEFSMPYLNAKGKHLIFSSNETSLVMTELQTHRNCTFDISQLNIRYLFSGPEFFIVAEPSFVATQRLLLFICDPQTSRFEGPGILKLPDVISLGASSSAKSGDGWIAFYARKASSSFALTFRIFARLQEFEDANDIEGSIVYDPSMDNSYPFAGSTTHLVLAGQMKSVHWVLFYVCDKFLTNCRLISRMNPPVIPTSLFIQDDLLYVLYNSLNGLLISINITEEQGLGTVLFSNIDACSFSSDHMLMAFTDSHVLVSIPDLKHCGKADDKDIYNKSHVFVTDVGLLVSSPDRGAGSVYLYDYEHLCGSQAQTSAPTSARIVRTSAQIASTPTATATPHVTTLTTSTQTPSVGGSKHMHTTLSSSSIVPVSSVQPASSQSLPSFRSQSKLTLEATIAASVTLCTFFICLFFYKRMKRDSQTLLQLRVQVSFRYHVVHRSQFYVPITVRR